MTLPQNSCPMVMGSVSPVTICGRSFGGIALGPVAVEQFDLELSPTQQQTNEVFVKVTPAYSGPFNGNDGLVVFCRRPGDFIHANVTLSVVLCGFHHGLRIKK